MLPRFNRVMIFDQQTHHASRPLSRACRVLRRVLVMKAAASDGKTGNKIDLLHTLTDGRSHSGKTFLEHLTNTSETLRKIGMPLYVQDAGLFHSVYGTESYKFSHPLVSEQLITSVIGEQAAYLVRMFCSVRPRRQSILQQFKQTGTEVWRDLALIEWANLRDQMNHSDFRIVEIQTALMEAGILKSEHIEQPKKVLCDISLDEKPLVKKDG